MSFTFLVKDEAERASDRGEQFSSMEHGASRHRSLFKLDPESLSYHLFEEAGS